MIELYKIALHHTYSYKPEDYFKFKYINNKSVQAISFAEWEHEGKSNAPCYYIAYNLACIHAFNGDLNMARLWLDAALKMNPSLSGLAEKDADLDNLCGETNPLIIELANATEILHSLFLSNIKKNLTAGNLNDRDSWGRTVLHHMIQTWPYKEVMPLIWAAGADANTTDSDGENALHAVCSRCRNVEYPLSQILPRIDDVNKKDADGKTAIILLLENYNSSDKEQLLRCLSLLVDAGVDPWITDLRGLSAFDMATGAAKSFLKMVLKAALSGSVYRSSVIA